MTDHRDEHAELFTSGPDVDVDGARASRAHDELFGEADVAESFVPSGPYVTRMGCRTPLEVDRDAPRPSWLTEAQALRELVLVEDAGYSMKSVSDPSRFGRRGTGGSAHAEGDVGQRHAERLIPVTEARTQAYSEPWVVCDTPRRELSIQVCRNILVWRTVGRHRVTQPQASKHARQGEARDRVDYLRKQRVHDRVEYKAEDVATDLSRWIGFEVTAGVVERVARSGRRAMRAYLRERGLLPRFVVRLDGPEEQREMNTVDESFDLDGWTEIADVIGELTGRRVHERTARDYASRRTDPLPVYVGLGRVVGKRSEVAEWVRRQFVPKTQAG